MISTPIQLLLHEHLTGGGFAAMSPTMAGADLRAAMEALLPEGGAMQQALLAELADWPAVCLSLTWTQSYPLPAAARNVQILYAPTDPASHERWLDSLIAEADVCWMTAPEQGGVLRGLHRRVTRTGRGWIGSDARAIAAATSKRNSARLLQAAGVPTLPCYGLHELEAVLSAPNGPAAWVVKPDDGTGCEDTWRVPTPVLAYWLSASPLEHRLRPDWLGITGRDMIFQPWTEGRAMSMTLRRDQDGWHVLGVNRQDIRLESASMGRTLLHASRPGARTEDVVTRMMYRGVEPEPPGTQSQGLSPEQLDRLAQALPGLHGLLGIDYIQTAEGPVVVDINPRVTSAYARRVATGQSDPEQGARAVVRAWMRAHDVKDLTA